MNVHWFIEHALAAAVNVFVGGLIAAPLLKRLRSAALEEKAKIHDLLDPNTPGGLGDLELQKGTARAKRAPAHKT